MMKILAIFGLILMFWCHQTQHHIFLLSPLGLASEEFIPVGAEADAKKLPESGIGSQDSVVGGSQRDKSESVNPEEKLGGSHVTTGKSAIKGDTHSLESEKRKTEDKQEALEPVTDVHVDNKISENANERLDKSQNVTDEVETTIGVPSEATAATSTSINDADSRSPDHADHVVEDLNKFTTVGEKSSNFSTILEEHTNESAQHADHHEPEIPPKAKAEEAPEASGSSETPHKEEEPIPSFMEWQKIHESLAQAQGNTGSGQQNGHNGHKTPHSTDSQQNDSTEGKAEAAAAKIRKESTAKNFASPDCGAKVIQSNPESQNSNGVLSSSHDEYMLNKCGIPIWFVVELCEPLKIEKVSLGNLELFSSSPKDVEIGISDRYPTRDWTKLGPFTLPDIRAIHSIVFPATNASTFGKFLKVNILSHYGTEHFCPLSLVRVNGISEYEVLESENTHPDSSEKEESALYEEPISDQLITEGNVPADKSVFGSAKDVVINIVKKAAQVLVKSDNSKDASQHGAIADSNSPCRSLLQCLPNYEQQIKERVLSLLSCNFSDLLPFLSKNSPWCGWDYCHSTFNKQSIGLPWQPEGFYASIFGGQSVLHALCNYHKPLSKESCDSLLETYPFVSSSDDNISTEGYINESLKSPPPVVGSYPVEAEDKKHAILEKDSPATNGKQDGNDVVTTPEVPNKVQISEPTQVPPPDKEGTTATTIPAINGEAQRSTATPPPATVPITTNGNSEDLTSSPPLQQQSQNNQQQGSGQQQQQKESVFVRLSNRIKTLERNQSLTASYLEELSRRFKKQNEENHHLNEGTKRFVNESRIKFKTLEDLYRFELRSLRRNTDEIRERLFNVQLQRSVLILLCLIQLLAILAVCVWAKRRFGQFESQLQNMTPQQQPSLTVQRRSSYSPITSAFHDSPQQSLLHVRKRINSDASVGSSLSSFDKSKKFKKKKKKLENIKPINVKSSGPASAPIEDNKKGTFKFEYPVTSSSAYNISLLSNFKENIKPEPKTESDFVPDDNKSANFGRGADLMGVGNPSGVSLLSTQVDSPFTMMSSTGTNLYMDPGVSTSSRFALLASPGPGTVGKQANIKRSGSLTSLDDRSSLSSYGAPGIQSITNGHEEDGQSQRSNGSGKKRKNKGLKAFMPKIFDR